MIKFHQPNFVIEYTPKSVSAILSAAALNGEAVQLDVYKRLDVGRKFEATGQRVAGNLDVFRVSLTVDDVADAYDWSYNILRESADRARKK
jgi:hypothetical protein